MGFFSKLFGSDKKRSDEKQVEPVEYKGFLIYQEAQAESGQYRVAGRITKQVDGELKQHLFVRSDVLPSEQDANELMLSKAKMFIEQMHGKIF